MKNNVKKLLIMPLIVITFFACINFAFATSYATIPSGGKNIRQRATSNSSLVEYLPQNTKVLLLQENVTGENNSGCTPNKWHKVKDMDNNKEGYICAADVAISTVADVDMNGDFEKQMLNKGFPSSYLPYLKTLHEKHPNWTFTAINTGLDYNASIQEEYTYGNSLVDGSDKSLRSTDAAVYNSSTGEYYNLGWDRGWYAASWNTISYYMDPRNFLNEQYIFMFEQLSYNSSYQTSDAVRGILGNTYMARYSNFDYASVFINAGRDNKISPLHLASRVNQETGNNGTNATSGNSFVFEVDNDCMNNFSGYSDWNKTNNCGNNQTYSGIYNFYSIGAYGSYKSPAIRGLIWANGGFDGSVTTYGRPWNTKERAISGGAKYIAENFISKGQDTIYFERFNVKPGAANRTYTNQYMTNIRAHSSEAYKNYNTYSKNNALNNSFEFLIPVYKNMPGETYVPTKQEEPRDNGTNTNTNNTISLNTIKGSVGARYDGNYISRIAIGKTANDLNNAAKSANSNASVVVKNSNGSTKSGVIGTGDKIKISNGSTSVEYTAVVYGDVNGDGKVTIVDLLRVQKIILNSANLSEPYLKAADTNKDGRVTIVDLLRVQKHILGSISIEQ